VTVAWIAAALFLAGAPQPHTDAFWNVKPPSEWSAEEVREILQHSPWATVSKATMGGPLKIHLASAEPMIEAEIRERQARRYKVEPGPSFEEYQALIKEGNSIALAVLIPDPVAMSDAIESRSLERDSVLHVGKRTYKLVTYFPPNPGDPYLRYVFPREVKPGDKSLMFDIYIPGIAYPQRHIEFDLKEMVYKGRPTY
jgi:hypothetical protein